jgi:hypothetical protein
LSDDIAVNFGANTGDFIAGVDEVKEKVEGLRAPFDALQDRLACTLDRNADGLTRTAECVNQLTLDLETLGVDGFAALKPLIDFCVYALDGFAKELDQTVHDTETDIQNILNLGKALNKYANWASFGAIPMGNREPDLSTSTDARGRRDQAIGTSNPASDRGGKGADDDAEDEKYLDREIIEDIGQRIAVLDAEKRAADIDFESQIAHLQALVKEGKLSAGEALAQEQALNVQKWSSDENYLQQKLDLYDGDAAAMQRVQGEELTQTAEFNAKMLALSDRAAEELQRGWKQSIGQISDLFAAFATDIVDRTKSISRAFDEMIRSLLDDFLKSSFRGLFNELLFGSSASGPGSGGLFGDLGGDLLKAFFGNAFKGLLGNPFSSSSGGLLGGLLPLGAGVAGGGLLSGGAGFGNTASDFSSATGGAIFGGLFSALLSPFKLLGGLLGFEGGGLVPSAAGGWVVPHFDNGGILSVLHQNEMVLPANISGGLQNMIAGGGGGSGHTINISAIDGASVARLFRNNGSALVTALNSAMRNGSMLAQPS